MKALLYLAADNVNPELGYTMRMNYSYTENFIFHYHDYFEFFLTFGDPVIHTVNGQEQFLPSQSLVFVRPQDAHTYINKGDFSFVNVAFSSETMSKLCEYFGSAADKILSAKMPPVVILDKVDYNRIMNKLNSLNVIKYTDKSKLRTRMKIILSEILSYFIDTPLNEKGTDVPLWLSGLTSTLKSPEKLGVSLDDMVSLTGKSREHISRSFKKYLGITVSEFMTEQKLNYSANLLLNTNLSVIDVCFECGFQNLSWFYRKFNDKFKVTPSEFRKNAKK